MMNRVFAPSDPIDLDTLPPVLAPASPVAPRGPIPPAAKAQRPRRGFDLTLLAFAVLGGFGLAGGLGAVLLARQWAGLQNTLSHERNLLLMERLRTLGPASAAATTAQVNATPPAPVLDPQPSEPTRSVPSMEGLPPPPPEEPWMRQLSELPAPQVKVLPLRVPLNPSLAAAAPPASPRQASASGGRTAKPGAPENTSAPLPQLVGLVGAPSGAGSAIFQIGEATVNVSVGESIGGSGWRLRAADDESVLIERGAERRRVSIVSGS